jgi:CRISPR-associated protein Cas6
MQFWQESEHTPRHSSDNSVIDLSFRLACRTLPLDHAYDLSKAICAELTWIDRELHAGIHLIHGAESGNGWQRPENAAQDVLQLSKRTRLTLRLPKERMADAEKLVGKQLNIGEHSLTVGKATVKTLNDHSTLFSRYVVTDQYEDESGFNSRVANELIQMEIRVRKLLCGRTLIFTTPDKPVL